MGETKPIQNHRKTE